MSKPTIHNVPDSAQETPLPGMPVGVGTKFQGHFHHIPLPPNHPFTTDDIGSTIALTMTVIMISSLIQSYKYRSWGKEKVVERFSRKQRVEERVIQEEKIGRAHV